MGHLGLVVIINEIIVPPTEFRFACGVLFSKSKIYSCFCSVSKFSPCSAEPTSCAAAGPGRCLLLSDTRTLWSRAQSRPGRPHKVVLLSRTDSVWFREQRVIGVVEAAAED